MSTTRHQHSVFDHGSKTKEAAFNIVLLYLVATLVALPQDALRHSLAGENATRLQSLEQQDYNLRLGNARLMAEASLGLELNDNVRLTPARGAHQNDIILSPSLKTGLSFPVTELNALQFSIGLGYAKYLLHPQYDYLIVTPGSQLAFDVFLRDLRLTFFDRFEYTQDPLQNATISGAANYGGIDNAAGINSAWDLNTLILTAIYAHQNFIPDQEEFAYLTRSSEFFFSRAAFLIQNGVAIGPEASASIMRYDQNVLNDALSYSVGAFAEMPLSPHLRVSAHSGFVSYDFEQGNQELGKSNTYYFSAEFVHSINPFISHSLSGSRDIAAGTFSSLREQSSARYLITLKLIRNVGLGAALFFEYGSYPPVILRAANMATAALPGETYDRFGATVHLSYRLMQKLRTTLGYRFTLRNSELQSRHYRQSALTWAFSYRF